MKRLTLILTALLTLIGVGNAQTSGFHVGYCQGEMGPFPSTADEYFANVSTQKDTWTSAAILLSADKVKMFEGNELREVSAALASKLNVDGLRVWVRSDLNGENLAEGTAESVSKNWNTVSLNVPLAITAETGALYIGYSYHQKSTSKAMSALEQGVPGLSCFVQSGSDEWTDHSENYTTCVEAVFYGDNLPKYDLTLEAATLQKNFVVDEGTFNFSLQVRNNATVTITGFDVLCTIEGITDTYSVHCDSVIAYGEVKTVKLTANFPGIQTMDPAKRTLTLIIDNLNEGKDENMSDNSMTGSFSVTLHSFVRNVLLEEFTTEKCVNCPRVASYIHDAMNEPEFEGRLFTTEHHAGYYTDNFTTRFDTDWCWFYDNQYAPAVMYDRYAQPDAITPVSNPGSKQEMYSLIRERMRETAFVSLKVTAEADVENLQIKVRVTGSRAKEDFTRQPARITVVLTETNLAAISQAGASGEYIHYNVGRRVNSTWGDVIEWEGDDYTYECVIPYNQNYVFENLGILAFVHDYDPSDKTKCEVANTMAITASQFGNGDEGIRSISTDGAAPRYYDASGRISESPVHGLNIVVRGDKVSKEWH